MMHHHLEVLRETSDHSLVRVDGSVDHRYLDHSIVDELVDGVEEAYRGAGLGSTAVRSGDLVTLGRRLYDFLDGDRAWLDGILSPTEGAALRIDADERLRQLPWELMARDDTHLIADSERPLLPIRIVGTRVANPHPVAANRPLRILFMATSPQGVRPSLDVDHEEAVILDAIEGTGTELVIEESGTLEGLRFLAGSFGPGHFDVLHLAGHAASHDGSPVLVVEDEVGRRVPATPEEIARSIDGRWPSLVVVSGCRNGDTPSQGGLPSLSESLVRAGAPAVLSWAVPTGDRAGTIFANLLYEQLAAGTTVAEAVAVTLRRLHAEGCPFWHHLRLYTDRSPIDALVTPFTTANRQRSPRRDPSPVFLASGGRVPVADRSSFVGRRRVIQRCLQTLKAPRTGTHHHEGILLHGSGGVGKSAVAARLLERMPTHRRIVWSGPVDEFAFRRELTGFDHGDDEAAHQVSRILNGQGSLATRLQDLMAGPLATIPCLFVFDGFEQGNLDLRPDKTMACSPGMEALLVGLLDAIRGTDSPSRVVITSRHNFLAPAGSNLRSVSLEPFDENELAKKVRHLRSLRPSAATDPATRVRAVAVAAGNARLLEWLDTALANDQVDAEAVVAAVEGVPVTRRLDTLAQALIGPDGSELRQFLARINVVELPIPEQAVQAIATGSLGCTDDGTGTGARIEQATALGLLAASVDPGTGEPRYLVAEGFRSLLRSDLGESEQREACAAAARSLNELWLGPAADRPPRVATDADATTTTDGTAMTDGHEQQDDLHRSSSSV